MMCCDVFCFIVSYYVVYGIAEVFEYYVVLCIVSTTTTTTTTIVLYCVMCCIEAVYCSEVLYCIVLYGVVPGFTTISASTAATAVPRTRGGASRPPLCRGGGNVREDGEEGTRQVRAAGEEVGVGARGVASRPPLY